MLIPNPHGHYRFLPGGEPYSSGVVADPGYEIVHVTFHRPLPWREGFSRLEAHLRSEGRDRNALCAVELRSPGPFTRSGFLEFNRGYRALLQEWGLLVDGANPIARTNVAPAWNPPGEPVLYGFGYTQPSEEAAPTFIVAGCGELRGGPMLEAPVVRPGETTPDAMREKASYVMHNLSKRLTGLGVTWEEATCIEVYTLQPFQEWAGEMILDRIGAATRAGLRWHPSRPPIDELEFEMDVRGVRRELVI